MAEVTSRSCHALRVTAPNEPAVAPSMAGWLFQVVAVSDQVVLLTSRTVPPTELPPPPTLSTCSRNVTPVIGSLTPDTVKRRNVRRTGELSTCSWAAVPKLVEALLDWT